MHTAGQTASHTQTGYHRKDTPRHTHAHTYAHTVAYIHTYTHECAHSNICTNTHTHTLTVAHAHTNRERERETGYHMNKTHTDTHMQKPDHTRLPQDGS